MTLVMRDSVNPGDLTPGADAYLGYVDGAFANFSQVKAKFPHALILSLAVFAQHDADGCDCEAGDLMPWQVGPWVKRQLARGAWRPVVYCSASVVPTVLADILVAGLHRGQIRLWSAHYGAGKHICGPKTCAFPGVPDCDGTQWTDKAPGTGPRPIDESILLPGFFTPPHPPSAGPFPHLTPGAMSLEEIATRRNTTAEHLVKVSVGAYTPGDLLRLTAAQLPAGIRYYTTNA